MAAGFSRAVVPPENAAEAALVPGIQVVSATSLTALLDWLKVTGGGDDGTAMVQSRGMRILEPGIALAAAESVQPAPGQAGRRVAEHGMGIVSGGA